MLLAADVNCSLNLPLSANYSNVIQKREKSPLALTECITKGKVNHKDYDTKRNLMHQIRQHLRHG